MNILMLHNRYQQAGGEDVSVRSEVELLRQRGHEVRLVEADNARINSFVSRLKTAVDVIYSTSARRHVAQEIAGFRPHLVHVQNFFPLLSPSIYYACREAGVPVVQTLRNYRLICSNALLFRDGHVCEECVGRSFAWPGIFHGCYRDSRAGTASIATMQAAHRIAGTWEECVDTYVALTEFSRSKFVQGGLPASKIVVKPNFVSCDGPVGAGRGGYAFFVGRLSPEKGVDVLLDAWRQLGDRIPLRIVGDGPLADRVRAAASSSVSYLGLGRKEEVLKQMRDASLLVFPSLCFETFGRVVAEAFSVGLPVIASDLDSSLVAHRRNGLLFRSGDSGALAEQVAWALDHPGEWSYMRQQARAEYEEKYTPERNYQLLMDIYNRTLQQTKEENPEPVAVCH